MLSYQHGYHAGNFADVIKHAIQTRLLDYLTKKEKPLFYLETHAGRGLYDLRDKQALKTGEAQHGIELLWAKRKQLPPVFAPYMACISQLNDNGVLRFYPGSPHLAIQALRTQDRSFLCEKHPGEYKFLEQLSTHGKRVFYSDSDGPEQLIALLPPPERRGLIFVDPSYDIKSEYQHIPRALKAAYRRFSTGTYCLWYPIIDNKLHEQILRGLADIGAEHYLSAEFHLTTAVAPGMRGCGLWIINPPHVLHDEVTTILQTLRTVFNPGVSSYQLKQK